MAGEWEGKTLAELAAHTERPFAMGPFGSNIRAENYRVSGVPVIRGLNLSDPGGPRFIDSDFVFLSEEKADELSSSNAFPGDLVFVAQGTIGKVGLIPLEGRYKRYVLSQNLMKASIAPDAADPMFVFYYFRSQAGQHEILSRANPTGVPCISRPLTSLKSFEVSLPALPEQQAIACILGTLDDKIELNRRTNETLEAMAQATFKSWFVDFDPVRSKAQRKDAKAQRRKEKQEQGPLASWRPGGFALNPAIADLFPDAFEGPELGEIPKGWSASSVGAHFVLTMGQSPPGSTYNEAGDGVPFYQGCADFRFRFPSRRVFCTAPTRSANPGDTLVSVRAPVGDVNMASEQCAVGRGVAALRHRSGSRSFTYYSMHNLGDHFGKFEAEGTVFGSINKADFERLPFVVPSPEVLNAFERVASPLDDRIESNERQSSTLAALRDALLPRLISGELRVPDAEKLVEAAA